MKQLIHEALSEAAAKYPQNMALWSESGTLNYTELEHQSSALANYISQQLTGTGHRVSLLMAKGNEAIIAIFAILKSGNTYVPLGESWSVPRLEKIFNDGKFSLCITDQPALFSELKLSELPPPLVTDSAEWKKATQIDKSPSADKIRVSDSSLAYILYTSGSTGTPKGVCVSHHAAQHFPAWARQEYELTPTDRIASVSPLTFDLTTFDLFATLGAGATLYLVPEKLKMFPARLTDFLEQHAITIIYAVPSTLILMLQRGKLPSRNLSALKTVLFAGEEFPVPLFNEFAEVMPDHISYSNLYGPTETNVCSYFHVPANFNDAAIPIGNALPDTDLFLRDSKADENGRGELCVQGPTVMEGYFGVDDSKANYWIKNTQSQPHPGYATGDQVSKTENGIWCYHGRIDKMVKIYGYRVELGEIEVCLMGLDWVDQAVVVTKTSSSAIGDVLVAFLLKASYKMKHQQTHESETSNDLQKLITISIDHCKRNLPPYMVPREIRLVDHLPVNNTGKTDRKHLERIVNDND